MDEKEFRLDTLIANGSREAVIQNLQDAGCTVDTIECCITCMEQGKKKELLKRLDEHRMDLLNKLHEEEKQIDCLDYLVYQVRHCN